jgi:Domain of unknown function (DUF5107)
MKVDTRWSFEGFPVLRLENEALTVDVLPDLGGKILQITHRTLGRSFLWHNPRQRLRRLPLGASYDDHFFGGWDELLPNDVVESIAGETLVDHGELWTTPLSAVVEGMTVVLSGLLPITPLRFEKRIALTGGKSIEVRYKLENTAARLMTPTGSPGCGRSQLGSTSAWPPMGPRRVSLSPLSGTGSTV